ncbi:dual specificity protein phosphatase (YVH1) [Plasmodium ovale curtisi]|uniref:protein-tyrosine-phosphatase n=1 Tax=Plasmodium ovale curtisi TaxID=864141 RepID=A0A1A8VRK2_PLAOA|nr:dual specificity protein phosphatase (YVH1) [Plasmodium ovale curtisi]
MIVKVFDHIFISNVYNANDVYRLINLNIGGVLTCFDCKSIDWCRDGISEQEQCIFYKDKLVKCKGNLVNRDNNDNELYNERLNKTMDCGNGYGVPISDNATGSFQSQEIGIHEIPVKPHAHYDYIIFPPEIESKTMDKNTINDYVNAMEHVEDDVQLELLPSLAMAAVPEGAMEGTTAATTTTARPCVTDSWTHGASLGKAKSVCEMNHTIREGGKVSWGNVYSMKHMYLHILDTFDENILNHVHSAHSFIDDVTKEDKNILVHCMAGISRCSSIILSYVSKKNKKGIKHNFSRLKSMYPFAQPNENFYRQLLLYEKMNYTLDGYSEYHDVYTKIKFDRKYLSQLVFLNLQDDRGHSYKYSCKFILFYDTDIVEHDTEKLKIKKKVEFFEREEQIEQKELPHVYGSFCTSLFIKKKEWLLTEQKMKGPLHCPNTSCKIKLGKWSWTGICCSCGYLQIPAFMINMSNIDRMAINQGTTKKD